MLAPGHADDPVSCMQRQSLQDVQDKYHTLPDLVAADKEVC